MDFFSYFIGLFVGYTINSITNYFMRKRKEKKKMGKYEERANHYEFRY